LANQADCVATTPLGRILPDTTLVQIAGQFCLFGNSPTGGLGRLPIQRPEYLRRSHRHLTTPQQERPASQGGWV